MSAHDLKDPQGNRATVPYAAAFLNCNDGVAALIDDFGVAKIQAASQGIKAIVAVLMQRETDLELDGENLLTLAPVTVTGLLHALAACASVMEQHGTGQSDCSRALDLAQYHAAHQATMPKRPATGSAKK